jgi:hypothetical protein
MRVIVNSVRDVNKTILSSVIVLQASGRRVRSPRRPSLSELSTPLTRTRRPLSSRTPSSGYDYDAADPKKRRRIRGQQMGGNATHETEARLNSESKDRIGIIPERNGYYYGEV